MGELVDQAKARTEHLTPEQVAAEVQGGKALLIDLREADDRARDGVIPGAVQHRRLMRASPAAGDKPC